MNIDFNIDEEYDEAINYTKVLYKNKELCIICQVDETADGNQWHRYKTRCGHITHTRCFRRWCYYKQCVFCPYCGNLENNDANYFCSDCNKFGHHCAECPKMMKDKFLRQFMKTGNNKSICCK